MVEAMRKRVGMGRMATVDHGACAQCRLQQAPSTLLAFAISVP